MKKTFRTCLIALIMSQTLFATDVTSTNQSMLVNTQDIGQIFKGTEVIRNGNSFKIHGYVINGNETTIFFSTENKIEIAKLKNEFSNKYKVIKEIQDDDGVKWKEIELDFNLKDDSAIVQKQKKVYAEE